MLIMQDTRWKKRAHQEHVNFWDWHMSHGALRNKIQ